MSRALGERLQRLEAKQRTRGGRPVARVVIVSDMSEPVERRPGEVLVILPDNGRGLAASVSAGEDV